MTKEPSKLRPPEADVTDTGAVPVVVDRVTFQAELDALRLPRHAAGCRSSSWTQLSR